MRVLTDHADFSAAVEFDPLSGRMFWRPRAGSRQSASWNARNAGRQIGCIGNHGYMDTSYKGQRFLVHQLVWFFVTGEWPTCPIDHINGIRTDNRFENLRLSSAQANAQNQGLRRNNTSGHVGVGWVARKRRWKASIMVRGKTLTLGYFRDKTLAVEARRLAAQKHGFDPRHGQRPAHQEPRIATAARNADPHP